MFVFRAEENEKYNDSKDLKPRTPGMEDTVRSLINHISNASGNEGIQSPYISTSRSISVMNKYSHGRSIDKPRAQIYLINLDDSGITYYDFCAKDTTALSKLEKTAKQNRNYVLADQEVTIYGTIPSKCIKKMDLMLFDALDMLCSANYEDIVNDALKKFFDGEVDIEEIINQSNFNELEKKFIDSYYGEKRPHIETVARDIFGKKGSRFYAQCLRTQISKTFCINLLKMYFKDRKIDENRLLGKLDFDQKMSTTSKLFSSVGDSYIRNGIAIPIKMGQSIEIPSGMSYSVTGEKVDECSAKYRLLSRSELSGITLEDLDRTTTVIAKKMQKQTVKEYNADGYDSEGLDIAGTNKYGFPIRVRDTSSEDRIREIITNSMERYNSDKTNPKPPKSPLERTIERYIYNIIGYCNCNVKENTYENAKKTINMYMMRDLEITENQFNLYMNIVFELAKTYNIDIELITNNIVETKTKEARQRLIEALELKDIQELTYKKIIEAHPNDKHVKALQKSINTTKGRIDSLKKDIKKGFRNVNENGEDR